MIDHLFFKQWKILPARCACVDHRGDARPKIQSHRQTHCTYHRQMFLVCCQQNMRMHINKARHNIQPFASIIFLIAMSQYQWQVLLFFHLQLLHPIPHRSYSLGRSHARLLSGGRIVAQGISSNRHKYNQEFYSFNRTMPVAYFAGIC